MINSQQVDERSTDPFALDEVTVHDPAAADETLRCSIYCKLSDPLAGELFNDTASN